MRTDPKCAGFLRTGADRWRGETYCHAVQQCAPRNHAGNFRGKVRNRSPEAANTALATAGAIGGVPSSPTPPGSAMDVISATSTDGISAI